MLALDLAKQDFTVLFPEHRNPSYHTQLSIPSDPTIRDRWVYYKAWLLYYLESDLGLFLIPLHSVVHGKCTCGRKCGSPGKHPAIRSIKSLNTKVNIALASGNEEQREKTRLEIYQMFKAQEKRLGVPLNIGLRTGLPFGNGQYFTVIDFDRKSDEYQIDIENLMHTKNMTYRTQSGGIHVWTVTPFPFISSIRLTSEDVQGFTFDIRSKNAYIAAPGSVGMKGPYLVDQNWISEHHQRFIQDSEPTKWLELHKENIFERAYTQPLHLRKENLQDNSWLTKQNGSEFRETAKKILKGDMLIPEGARNYVLMRLLAYQYRMGLIEKRRLLEEAFIHRDTRMESPETFLDQEVRNTVRSVMKFIGAKRIVRTVQDSLDRYSDWVSMNGIKNEAKIQEVTKAKQAIGYFFDSLHAYNKKRIGEVADKSLNIKTGTLSSVLHAELLKHLNNLCGDNAPKITMEVVARTLKEMGFVSRRVEKGVVWNLQIPEEVDETELDFKMTETLKTSYVSLPRKAQRVKEVKKPAKKRLEKPNLLSNDWQRKKESPTDFWKRFFQSFNVEDILASCPPRNNTTNNSSCQTVTAVLEATHKES